jgi:hypothetical protein
MPQAKNLYYEVRTMRVFGPPTPIASDIARHLQSRQFLGMTVVVCANPSSLLSALRKQWLRLARNLQKQRASTLNAEEILRFTHTIMHMQHLQFVAHAPVAQAGSHIFFTTPDELTTLPPGCLSLYITTPPRASQLTSWIDSLSADALVVDYEGTLRLGDLGLQPKKHMESRMLADWEELCAFIRSTGVDGSILQGTTSLHSHAMDAALDSLLSSGTEFLRRAAAFQHILSLSQPVKIVPATQQKQFETVMRLAHRIQSLTPGNFNSFLVKHFGDRRAESFFLRDAAPEEDILFMDDAPEEMTYYSMQGVPLRIEYV